MPTIEKKRLRDYKEGHPWKKWGPYLTERQWGTVREDYSPDGSAWEYITHDHARSKAYRWGEEGIAGISDDKQLLCMAMAFWNYKDPIIKERIFGLTGNEGNHGEDPKEYYYYLDSTPTHSYMKMLYKYSQHEYPYSQLVIENRNRGRQNPEYELVDTGVFNENKYFDIFVEYAKADVDDILVKITVCNRGKEDAKLAVMPTIWFRNTWSSTSDSIVPKMFVGDEHSIKTKHPEMDDFHLYCKQAPELLFCNNETNSQRLYNCAHPNSKYFKDGINEYLIHDNHDAVCLDREGTKAAAKFDITVKGEGEYILSLRLVNKALHEPFGDFDALFNKRKDEADEFYNEIQTGITDADLKDVQRQAFAGMMWGKQFYYMNVAEWLDGDPGQVPPPAQRKNGRNIRWRHMTNADIISMPDKWEYPWYAAWDLAFHCIPIARIDPDFSKGQLELFLREWYMHPNGQIPAYEWNFGDVNPPVHAYAVLRVFQIDKKVRGDEGDIDFLEECYHKLLLNFTWWVNQKDTEGNNIFEGGFLGLDNIGVFDRSNALPTGGYIEQADGTSWMAMYSLNMLRISLELAVIKPVYQHTATKFLEHFLFIAGALNNIGSTNVPLWDDEDNFYYDILHTPDGKTTRLKVRSMVGLIPLFAVETLKPEALVKLDFFRERLEYFLKHRPDLANLVSRWTEPGAGETRLLSLLRGFRMKRILKRMLDETEFLSEYGIRALSKFHKDHPYNYYHKGTTFSVGYLPAESDSGLFGGNSNWRGPIWFPVNYLIIESLLKFHSYYGDDFKIEYPTGSNNFITIKEVAAELSKRMMKIFTKDAEGKRAVYNHNKILQTDPNFKDYILFYEYFHGDDGSGVGANHQTGWTGLIADMIHKFSDKY
jgi:Glycosyl hydrolase family 63 C-terminal domain